MNIDVPAFEEFLRQEAQWLLGKADELAADPKNEAEAHALVAVAYGRLRKASETLEKLSGFERG